MRNFTRNFKMFTLAIALFSMSAGAVGQGQIIYETGFESSDGFIAGMVYNQELTVGPEGKQWKTSNGTPSTTAPISGAQSMQMRAYKNSSTIPFVATDFALSKVTKVEFSAANSGGLNITVDYSTDGINYIGGQDFELSASKKEYSYTIDENGVNIVKLRFIITNPTVTATHRVYIDDLKVYGVITGPSVSTTPSSIILNSSIGAESTENINIKGSNLTGDLTISVSGDAFSTTVSTVSQSDATAGFDIPVKFAPTARGSFSGTLTISGGGLASDVNVVLSGKGGGELIASELNTSNPVVTLANDFEDITNNVDYSAAGWLNIGTKGDRVWQGKTFTLGGNVDNYLQATAFSSANPSSDEFDIWLITPAVDFSNLAENTKLRFDLAIFGGVPETSFGVYHIAVNGSNVVKTKLTTDKTATVDNEWVTNVNADITGITGVGFIAFNYNRVSGTTAAASYRIDNVNLGIPTSVNKPVVNDQSIYVQNGQLIVVAQNSGAMVEVYNIAGQRVATQATDAGRNVITLPKGQIYIVKVGNTVKKVAL